MIAPQQHSIQDSPPDQKTRGNETSPSHTDREKALRELRERLDYRWREVVEESNIDPTVALERGYYLEKTKRGLARLGFPRAQQKAPALVIPRFNPAGEPIPCQIKPDIPTAASDKNGKPRVRKYESPPGHPVRLSVSPRVAPMMRNVSIPLWLTEGDKKGDALASVGEAVLALQGVDCYRVLEDWDHVRLAGREVIIAFDADVMVNPNVQKSLQKLARFLQDRGALVRYVRWPEKYRGTKTGVDDYLSAGGDIGELRRGAQDHPDEDSIPVGIKLSDVERETIKWFWERLVPYGKITVMDGDPGLGKSVVVTDLAARQTAGADLPYGTGKLEAAGVVMLAAEDDAGDTILPRFEAACGVAERVILLGTEEMLGLPSDIPVIERAMKRVDARLVVIDPLMAFFDEDVNPNGDKDVRRALIPLKHLAARTGAAFLLVRHPNKMVGQNYLYRGAGLSRS